MHDYVYAIFWKLELRTHLIYVLIGEEMFKVHVRYNILVFVIIKVLLRNTFDDILFLYL